MSVEAREADEAGELEELLGRAGGRPERLGPAGVRRVAALHRSVSAELARTRRTLGPGAHVRRLEALVGRARLALYEAEPARRGGVRAFLGTGYGREVRARGAFVLAAWALLLAPAALAYAWAIGDPGAAVGVVPEEFADPRPGRGEALGLSGEESAGISAQIFVNNIRVTFLEWAAGIALGLGTALVIVFNGMLLGVVLGLTADAGLALAAVELIVPHGLLELSCLAVTGGAGLKLGWTLVDPGRLSRGEALRREAPTSALVVLGTVPWLVLAGLVEGFVTGTGLGLGGAAVVGIALAVPFWALVLRAGRGP